MVYCSDMSESEVTRLIDEAVERAGGLAVPIVGSFMQKAGLPDRRYESKVWSGWVEWKRNDGFCTRLQSMFLYDLWLRESPYLLIRTFADGDVHFLRSDDGEGLIMVGGKMLTMWDLGKDEGLKALGVNMLLGMKKAWELLLRKRRTNAHPVVGVSPMADLGVRAQPGQPGEAGDRPRILGQRPLRQDGVD